MDQKMGYEIREGQLLFKPEGILTFYNIAPFAESVQAALHDTGATDVVIDCAELTLLDSSALGTLAGLAKKLRDLGGQVKLADVMNSVTSGLFSLRLDRIMPIFNTVEEALQGSPGGVIGHPPLKPQAPGGPEQE